MKTKTVQFCPCGNPARSSGHGQRYCDRCHADYMREWRKTHPLKGEAKLKAIARCYLNVYLKRGTIQRQACEICGEQAQPHHHDYSKPLDVRWLCRLHHLEEHGKVQHVSKHSPSRRPKGLTQGQKDTFRAIRTFWDEHRYAPGYRDLSNITGLSFGGTQYIVKRLAELRLIQYTPGSARSIRLKESA